MEHIIEFFAQSVMGNVRKNNEDNLFVDGVYKKPSFVNNDITANGTLLSSNSPVVGVFDGMGGESCGEIASFFCADETAKTIINPNKTICEQLHGICLRANYDVCTYSKINMISSAGSTVTAICFSNDAVYGCNLGDSRIYRYSNSALEMLSVDHVVLSGIDKKSPLSQYVGIPEEELILEPHFFVAKYNPDDIYLLCSDGVTDMLGDAEIAKIFSRSQNTATLAADIVNGALKNGGVDNTTLIVAKIIH